MLDTSLNGWLGDLMSAQNQNMNVIKRVLEIRDCRAPLRGRSCTQQQEIMSLLKVKIGRLLKEGRLSSIVILNVPSMLSTLVLPTLPY